MGGGRVGGDRCTASAAEGWVVGGLRIRRAKEERVKELAARDLRVQEAFWVNTEKPERATQKRRQKPRRVKDEVLL